ncbi:MAG TPA: vitamin K epoxide reductase family protein [Vicinamibacterales bacterium]|nr:vitamin K epoxide reductase family protein [Vicinamibacterales bacterium]
MTKRHVRATLIALCVLGLVASATSTYVHYRLMHDASYTSFCDISEAVNCETVYRSAYGTVAGIPVALGGVIWFSLALLLTFVSEPSAPPARPSQARRAETADASESSVSGYLFALSTVALAVVLYLAYASFFVLKTMCILCVLTYVAVVGIFIVSGASSPARLGSLPRFAARDLRRLARYPVALVIAILYLAGAASAIAFFPRDAVSAAAAATPSSPSSTSASAAPAAPAPAAQLDQVAGFEQWLDMQPRVPLAVPSDGAKVVIVKFNDYQCPPCKQTFLQYKPILQKFENSHPGQVKFITKDFPLEPECNGGGGHTAACEAAAAVRMARAKGRAEALEDWLFDNQPAMSPELVKKGAREVAQVTDFDAQYPRVLEQVKADTAYGRQLGVNRTPTFFINGIKIEGGLLPNFFEAAIAHELKRAQGSASKP